MKKIVLSILNLANSPSPDSYVVTLENGENSKRVSIIVGAHEAQAISLAMNSSSTPRPLTHDVFYNVLEHFGIIIKEVTIYDIIDGIFYAEMLCEQDGKTQQFDIRASDAIAMALRSNIPILANEKVFDRMEKSAPLPSTPNSNSNLKMPQMFIDKLEFAIKDAVKTENYEAASILRDFLDSLKKS